VNGQPRRAGFLHDQPILAGAQPRSTQWLNREGRSSLTAVSTGAPSQLEEPRPHTDQPIDPDELRVLMTELLDEQEANTPLPTNKMNNTVYTADLTTSSGSDHHRSAEPADPRSGSVSWTMSAATLKARK
jgi:hypothetical protein